MSHDDKELIKQVMDGDERAFAELVRKWQRPLVNFIVKYTGNVDDAQELIQETFRTVYEKLPSLKEPERFSSWIYKIALNQARMHLRRIRNRQTETLEDQTYENNEQKDVFSSFTASEQANPEERFSRQEMARVVRRALRRIDEKQRDVIMLKEYGGLKFTEIAEVLDAPLSTIKSRMYMGMENLKREILKIIEP